MDSLLNRYRNITVLLLVIFAQLDPAGLPGEERQRRADDPRLGGDRGHAAGARRSKACAAALTGFVGNYITLHDTREQNRRDARANWAA